MGPEFRYSSCTAIDDVGQEQEDARRHNSVDYSRFRFSNTLRRKLRGKTSAVPGGMQNRRRKKFTW